MTLTPSSPTSSTVDVSFPVSGMTCASCVNRVEKAVGKVEGVERAAVNLATERATVSYDPEQTSISAIASAVERAGYRAPGSNGSGSAHRGDDLRLLRAPR